MTTESLKEGEIDVASEISTFRRMYSLFLSAAALVAVGCNVGPSFDCQPRTLTTQQFSRELFIGTWSGCGRYQIDYVGTYPQELYCTFGNDGSLILREEYESGFSRTHATWELDPEAEHVVAYRGGDVFEF